MGKAFVAHLTGSDADLPVMEAAFDVQKPFDTPTDRRGRRAAEEAGRLNGRA